MIARLHAAFWNETSKLASFEWLSPKDEVIPTEAKDAALQKWNEIIDGMQPANNMLTYRQIEHLMDKLEDILSLKKTFPKTLCHGDFHMENVLLSADNSPVIADWQEVRIACGPEDISFFLQRASASGNPLSADTAIEVYTKTVNELVENHLSVSSVREVIDAAKLHTMLIHWPHFLIGAPSDVILGISLELKSAAGRLGYLA